ncbi:MAG TPA: glucose-6-phosphate isomerase family protein [Candidatus Acidoferrales bacterium]|nr:glucose-6-phosphate isomerase family protein [Candidatus Acidoferrales bacterium]
MIQIDWSRGVLQPNAKIVERVKMLGQLDGIFADSEAFRALDPNTVVYRVQAWCPVPEGTEGGLFWGTTVVEPGQVGSEYFMTHGHLHQKRNRTEYYGVVEGKGALILMDESRSTWTEPMSPGSLHFISPNTAHRVANVGSAALRFVACWPSDAGHDYESIRRNGFSARLLSVDGEAKLVGSDA